MKSTTNMYDSSTVLRFETNETMSIIGILIYLYNVCSKRLIQKQQPVNITKTTHNGYRTVTAILQNCYKNINYF